MSADDKPWTDKETLREQYHEKGLSQKEIAAKFGCSRHTIMNWVETHDLQKSHSECMTGVGESSEPWADPDTLRELYIEKDLSKTAIADKFGCNPDTIRYHLEKHDISKGDTCPTCGDQYTRIGSHWNRSNCPYPSLDSFREIINGMVMGDGTVNQPSGNNPSIYLTTIQQEFAEHLMDVFGILGASIDEVETENNEHKYGNKTQYVFKTRRHPELEEWAEWYSSGQKRFPEDLDMTPTTLAYWYAGDGHLKQNNYGKTDHHAIIYTINESDRKEWIVDKIEEDIGLSPRVIGKGIAFSVEESKEFFEITDPLPGFEYKWP